MGAGGSHTDQASRTPRFVDVLRRRDFAVLFGAETQSVVGDQLARVALSVLVFRQTNSVVATALTYTATFLPAILGGSVLAGLGDRVSRRLVMVGCDLLRAALFAAMALPGLPLSLVVALLVVAVFVGPAFSASEVSYLAAALPPELYRVGTGIRMLTNQLAQVVGFAAGGVMVAVLTPRGALLIDAATYLASALVVLVALPTGQVPAHTDLAEAVAAKSGVFAHLWRDGRIRRLLLLSWLAGLLIVPEGLAVPVGRQIHATTSEIGLLFASIPLGGALGVVVITKAVRPARRDAVATWMAVGAGVPLLLTVAKPTLPLLFVLWAVSGMLAAYLVEVTTAIIQWIPDANRARSMGLVSAGLLGAQGVGLGLFGAVAEWTDAAGAVAIAGLVAMVGAVALARVPARRVQSPQL
jgi:predicted MFS family arabinose efflux permease